MQEEVEQRVVTLIVNCSKMTEQELRKALGKLLTHLKTQHQTKQPHGKMTVKKLAAQNRGLQSVEVTDQNIGSFNRIARKYGIDFAPFKAKGQDRYLIFFKSQDADASPVVADAAGNESAHIPLRQGEEFAGTGGAIQSPE